MKSIPRILIAEDDPEQLTLLTKILKINRVEIIAALNGHEAFEKSVQFSPHVALIDVQMPGMNGIEALAKINTTIHDDPPAVILMSATLNKEIRIQGFSDGAQDFIQKPVDPLELTLKIQNILRMRMISEKIRDLNEKLRKEKKLLTKYFSNDLVEKILSEEISTDLGGQNVKVTILFFDLRNSTTIAESLPPDVFSAFLSEITGGVMKRVFASGGSVNKILGDGILATFGAPIPSESDPENALNCALEIGKYIAEYNGRRPEFLEAPVQYGIGIATGVVFAGNIGSVERIEYTVLGDAVNIAARLQAMTKEAGEKILTEDETIRTLKVQYNLKPLGAQTIRGRHSTVSIHSLQV